MKKFYYDPTKFKTYLEQLGIAYPTVRPIEAKPKGPRAAESLRSARGDSRIA